MNVQSLFKEINAAARFKIGDRVMWRDRSEKQYFVVGYAMCLSGPLACELQLLIGEEANCRYPHMARVDELQSVAEAQWRIKKTAVAKAS